MDLHLVQPIFNLKPCHLRNCTFCNGDSCVIVEGRVDAAFATIDTFTVLLQELDDEDLSDCTKAVMAAQPLLFEAQIHSQLSLADVEALYLPQEYKVPNTHVLRSRLAVAEELSRMYGWQVRFCC